MLEIDTLLGMNAATLRLAAIPRTGLLADTLLIVGGALFLALCAQISFALPFTPVPITLQTFGVLLMGASYGAVRGGLTAALYLLMGIVGIPVFADRATTIKTSPETWLASPRWPIRSRWRASTW